MILGFTGTSRGMTQKQRDTVLNLLRELKTRKLHFGDCVGADEQSYQIARYLKIYTVCHPPLDEKLRAFCRPVDEMRPQLPYLVRDKNIVKEGIHGLIAAPQSIVRPTNFRGQGTWTTIRYAEQAKRPIWLVASDGTFTEIRNDWCQCGDKSAPLALGAHCRRCHRPTVGGIK